MLGTLKEILSSLQKDIDVWVVTKDSTLPSVHTLLDKLEGASEDPVPVHLHCDNDLKSSVLYIFTSGTTGTVFPQEKDFFFSAQTLSRELYFH